MAHNHATSSATKAIAAFMKPYAKEFRRLEKKKRRASEWEDRAALREQLARTGEGQTENAKRARAESAYASRALDKASIAIMQAYHRQFKGWEFRSLREMNAAVSDENWGTGNEIKELGKSLEKERHSAAGRINWPVAIIGLATIAFCAVTGHMAKAGLIVLGAAAVTFAITEKVFKTIFSRRERALATWEMAAARVKGLVESGNGDDEMEAYNEEKALTEDYSLN